MAHTYPESVDRARRVLSMEPPPRVASGPTVLPSGTVTFVFTDIEASTARWERDPDAMSLALRRHDEIVRTAFTNFGGVVFKTIGDAFCSAFSLASSAVAAAVALQRALINENFSDVGGLWVRIAIHTGPAEERDGDYFGPTLNRVARILGTAHGGQTILSAAATALARGALPAGTGLVDLGTHRLKDIRDAEDLYQLTIDGLRNTFPAPTSIRTQNDNLPLPLTNFVGHANDLAELKRLVGEHRLVTIVGAGGIGKTRISLELGSSVREEYSGGVWFVDLAPLPDGSYVASAIAAALGIRVSGDRDEILRDIVLFVRRRRLLVIADNCEHVVSAAAHDLGAILRDAPEVRILATSREALRTPGEIAYRLPSLDVPEANVASAREALAFDSIALFVARAKSTASHFECTDDNVTAIAEIARRLDGIPLAIELAAARTSVLSPTQIVARLDERFRLLRGSRAALPRQQTMRALIDWSYDILTPTERTVMQRCAVFASGWALEWAATVCSDDGLDEDDVVETLVALVDKSIVSVRSGTRDRRFAFAESIRAYALEKLIDSGCRDALMRRLALHVAEIAAGLVAIARTYGPYRWRIAMRDELDNVRAAIDWSLGPAGDTVLGARIVADTALFLIETRFLPQCRHDISTILARADETIDVEITSKIWLAAATIGSPPDAVSAGRRAIDLATTIGRSDVAAIARTYVGFALWRLGRIDDAERELRRALATLGELELTQAWPYANVLDALASVLASKHPDEAGNLYRRASALFERLGDLLSHARVEGNLAELDFASGNVRLALARSEVAARVFDDYASPIRQANALANAAAYLIALEEPERAFETAVRSLILSRDVNAAQIAANALQQVASVMAMCAEPERAAWLLGYVDTWYAKRGLVRDPSDEGGRAELLRVLEGDLERERFERLHAEGSAFDEDAAVAVALAHTRDRPSSVESR